MLIQEQSLSISLKERMNPQGMVVTLMILVMLLSTTGCAKQDTMQGRIQDYQERLERVLDTEFPELDVGDPAIRYSLPKNLRRSTSAFTINWLDFFSIMHCDLNRLVGQRNSSLGKVMSASQRWRYEQEFLVVGQQCLEMLQKEERKPDLQKQLAEVLRVKSLEMVDIAWNATWAGPEFQQLMSFHDGPLPTDFRYADWSELTAALGLLVEGSEHPTRMENSSEPEEMNLKLVSYPVVGRLLLSVRQATLQIENINQGLRQVMSRRPVCFNQTPNPKARILSNVLTNIFIVKVQPYLAELNKGMEQWRPMLKRSYSALEGNEDNAFYQAYLADHTLMRSFKQSLTEHGILWTELLAQCGLSPGNPPSP
ncbi:DUF3080 family protein [Hahella sp. CCB-MM4]|uniref:DUF3080 family protein n=1 Tax=Hahella sp. (strain CCB-MM4) TaxID=1926491 RepID=UPI00143DAC38|nr:DUF3080 family protein [Hahella sp. CCB-MM4]